MVTETDLSRARQGARQSLSERDGLDHRQSGCSDSALRSTLQDIGHRKSAQMWRLLQWLQHHDSGSDPTRLAEAPVSEASAVSGEPEAAGPVSPDAIIADPPPAASHDRASIIERRDVTPDLIVFRVARPGGFEFSPGHSVKLESGGIRRSYSIVSAPHEPFLEFFVELAPRGQMSEQLRRLQAGDTLSLGTPKGGLGFDERVPNHLMVATVTGINPFISMVRNYLHRGQTGHRIVLMHGASYQDEFGYRQELEQLAAAHPEVLSYLPTVSRPGEPRNQTWTGATGRVDTLVDEVLGQHGLGPGDTLAYACGHSGMLESIAGQVQSRGFRLETESYD
jgi:ferredoxin-NADP reductase